jgi:uncharacterized protein
LAPHTNVPSFRQSPPMTGIVVPPEPPPPALPPASPAGPSEQPAAAASISEPVIARIGCVTRMKRSNAHRGSARKRGDAFVGRRLTAIIAGGSLRPMPPQVTDPRSLGRPPEALVRGERVVSIAASDGVHLDGRVYDAPDAEATLVLCHPHPLYGGTMHNAVILSFARALSRGLAARMSYVRFNLRGVERSEGRYDEGRGELFDVIAAIDLAESLAGPGSVALLGYSFGSWVGLRAAWQHRAVERIAIVAPPVKLLHYDLSGPRRELPAEVFVGDRDEFVTTTDAEAFAARLGARLQIIEGAGHLFVQHRRALVDRALPFLAARGGASKPAVRM